MLHKHAMDYYLMSHLSAVNMELAPTMFVVALQGTVEQTVKSITATAICITLPLHAQETVNAFDQKCVCAIQVFQVNTVILDHMV
jgi:hypothetical protein